MKTPDNSGINNMEQTHGTFDFLFYSLNILRYVPMCAAIILWAYHGYFRQKYHGYVGMKRQKRWHDLPRCSAAESKEDTLNRMIAAKKRQMSVSFRMAVMFSAIAVFWLFYIR